MLNHPGIAAVHDYGETDMGRRGRAAYLVMELINGSPELGYQAPDGSRCGMPWTCSSRPAERWR